uniref:Uncharacterized protein n=1 Tax=Beihai picobirna-like virus 13 TaxID=1922518 RepID=A0A1L3KLD9_9VIRU|nr:hypothetical protein [Beihai picobirna-like virus 13]
MCDMDELNFKETLPIKQEPIVIGDDNWLRTRDGYEYVLHLLNEQDHSIDFTYDWWIDQMNYPDTSSVLQTLFLAKGKPDDSGLKFNPIVNPVGPGLVIAASKIGQSLVTDVINDASTSAEEVIKAGADALRNQFKTRMGNMGRKSSSSFGGGDDGGTTTQGYSGGSPFNPTGLSLNLRPINSDFRTGVRPVFEPKYYLDGEDSNSPLILKYLQVSPELTGPLGPTANDFNRQNRLTDYFTTKITTDWRTKVIQTQSANTFISKNLNYQQLTTWYKAMSNALAIYYSYASIIAHVYLQRNRNRAMIELYGELNPQDLLNLYELRMWLNSQPIPPDLNDFMFHLYNNYKQSHAPGSPLVKFTALRFEDNSTSNIGKNMSADVRGLLNGMAQNEFVLNITTIIARAFPNWIDNDVHSYTGEPNFDAGWLTCWVNAPYIGSTNQTTDGINVPTVPADTSLVVYNSHTDAPDGWQVFASSVYYTLPNQNGWYGGVGAPKRVKPGTYNQLLDSVESATTFTSQAGQMKATCWIYAQDIPMGTQVVTNAFYPVQSIDKYQTLSGNTYVCNINNSGVTSYQRFGCELMTPHTIIDMYPTSQQVMDVLYSPTTNTKQSGTWSATGNNGKGKSSRWKSKKGAKPSTGDGD